MDSLKDLFTAYFGHKPISVSPIMGSGSDRRYMRLADDDNSAIGVIGTDSKENGTFIYLAHLMKTAGVNVSEIYNVSDDCMSYLQQDLGDTSLFSLLHTEAQDKYVNEVMSALPKIQFGLNPDDEMLYPVREMSENVAKWDLDYFKYCFLKASGVPFDETALETEFNTLVSELWSDSPYSYIYRDCQSRNIMVHDDKIYWIDFQSLRRGPVLYDVASFLWQARAGFSDEERMKYAAVYYEAMKKQTDYPEDKFYAMLRRMALMRTLQVLGAYGLRGITERKAHFLLSIPAALANAVKLTESCSSSYPELCRVLRVVASQERFKPTADKDKLHVKVFSFSYKKGYPEDFTGNGGGFMFDCRAMHNPGRYQEYKQLTGRDVEVIEFLEERGEVQPFLKAVDMLVEPAVERYINRNFNSLQIGFGCTGGQHRSVYCAEKTARHLAEKYGRQIRISLIHREQNIKEEL